MNQSLFRLVADTSFRERAAALAPLVPGTVAPLDGMFEPRRRFTAVRRQEARVARQERTARAELAGGRPDPERVADAVNAFHASVGVLSGHASTLAPLITPALDDVIALAADERHPLRAMLREAAASLGFSSEEAGWLFDELAAVHFRPVKLVCEGGFEDLTALLAALSMGEGGLLLAGFARFTGEPAADERLEKMVLRLRENGVTASVFLVIAIVLVAHAVTLCRRDLRTPACPDGEMMRR